MVYQNTDPVIAAQVRAIVLHEKSMSLSMRELNHRLRGYGYALKDTSEGTMITTLPHGVAICTLGDATIH